ncbi:hypothetical protein BO79DRAFT_231036 [Aspergillus costaricaensis CBS 115574]|uniref:Uncharacterized protein n=1 Tax=Aspergillus costaricaensis CBS 115574 TaxID=1448317 RepID=A0ACD1I6Z5_9EURO|nr:hypothetical protein BO79DRAFT_231036 [Aspergillus costaricaensis CBS 115574]RAK86000.1 hypothetical protein BO79DRAFT_231036 [Aspergillus costaricaensis CBS 115574]
MDGHSPTCSGSRNETRPEVAQDETQINTQPPTITDHRAVRVGAPPSIVSFRTTAADICANVGDIKPWMIGFLLSAKVNDNNKGRTRAADRMYRKEKKAKSTAACACMGPWPNGWQAAPYHLETESSQWLQTVLFWARRRTQKRCAQFHGSVHTRNITAGRSAGESWWCPLADWTGVVMTLTRILPPPLRRRTTHLIHRPRGVLQAQTIQSGKGSGPQRLAVCLQIDGARPFASPPMIGLSVHYASLDRFSGDDGRV